MSESKVWTDERIESIVNSHVVYSKHEGACVHTHTVRILMRQMRNDLQAALDAANERISEQDKRIAGLANQVNRLSDELGWYNATRATCSAAWCEIDDEVERLQESEGDDE